MRLSLASRLGRVLPFLIAIVAVAGFVHIGTILVYPTRAGDDAFARIAAMAPVGVKTRLDPSMRDGIPFEDAAMATAVCRFDLVQGPFRVAVAPLAEDFLSIGIHSRHGTAFYGLNVHAGEGVPITIVIMTDAQRAGAEEGGLAADAAQDLRIVAPEPKGFVVLQAPSGGPSGGSEALDRVGCSAGSNIPPVDAS